MSNGATTLLTSHVASGALLGNAHQMLFEGNFKCQVLKRPIGQLEIPVVSVGAKVFHVCKMCSFLVYIYICICVCVCICIHIQTSIRTHCKYIVLGPMYLYMGEGVQVNHPVSISSLRFSDKKRLTACKRWRSHCCG